jgi:glutathionyl-hydroquinone reductase
MDFEFYSYDNVYVGHFKCRILNFRVITSGSRALNSMTIEMVDLNGTRSFRRQCIGYASVQFKRIAYFNNHLQHIAHALSIHYMPELNS